MRPPKHVAVIRLAANLFRLLCRACMIDCFVCDWLVWATIRCPMETIV